MTGHNPPPQLLDSPQSSLRRLWTGPTRQRVTLWVVLLVLFGVVAEYGSWAYATVTTGRDPVGIEAVPDYTLFHVAGQILDEHGAVAVYDPALFATALEDTTGVTVIGGAAYYGHPPFFPPLFLPLQPLGITGGYLVWMVAGLLCLALVLRRIGVDALVPTIGILLLSEPAFLTIRTGQFSVWAACIIGGVFLLLRSDRPYAAGALLGLLAFKPILAVGIGLWWLLDARRYWKGIAGSFAVVTIQFALTAVLVPESLRAYAGMLSEDGDEFVLGPGIRMGLSLREFITMLIPGHVGVATVLWVATSAVLVWGFLQLLRSRGNELSVMFSAAVVLGVLITPRTGGYDWVVLVIPAAILWVATPRLRPLWTACGATLLIASFFSMWIMDGLDDSIGLALQIGTIALLAVAVAGWRALRAPASLPT